MTKTKWLIVGLGNPGSKYQLTRHNIGMRVVESFTSKCKAEFKFGPDCEFAEFKYAGQEVYTCLPTTYMNNSGTAVKKMLNKFAISPENIVICVDEYNFQVGRIHLKAAGSDGGHNGISSVIEHINASNFIRLRLGIGKDFGPGEMSNYVLSHFYPNEDEIVNDMIKDGVKALEMVLKIGFARAMSDVNAHQAKKFDSKSKNSATKSDKNNNKSFPLANKKPHKSTIHGMRRKDAPEVIKYLKAENKYAEQKMKDTSVIQEKIYKEIISRIQETDLSVPVKRDEYYYYSRTVQGLQYPIYCRRKGSMDAPEQIILDHNLLAEGKQYFQIGSISVSPNHEIVAYTSDSEGYETYTINFKVIDCEEILPDKIENASDDIEWANDNKTIFYSTLSDIQQADKVWKHVLDEPIETDKLVYHELDSAYFLSIDKTKDKSTILISLMSKDESEVWVIPTDEADAMPQLIRTREPKIQYYLESYLDDYLIVTNDEALNFKIVKAPKKHPYKDNWVDFLPYNENIKISSIEPYKDYLVINERSAGLSRIRIYNMRSSEQHYIPFPEETYSCYSNDLPDFNSDTMRFTYSSFITPKSVFDYNMRDGKLILLKETAVMGNYDKNNYITKRLFAKSHDGVLIPISIVHQSNIELSGTNPTLLTGYGSYGMSNDPSFSHTYLSLLERGFVIAIAHIRGGGENGEQWYLDGKMLNKRNTFSDFISCAEYLINNKYTHPEKLVIRGGSAGGLLIGAVLNLRPELFKSALAIVPFVDVLNTMLDASIPLTVAEYSEWGNPEQKEYFDYISSYSPYDNVKKMDYPNILIRAGLNDPRVHYWEPAKWNAKLKEFKTDNNLLLLVTEMDSGHGGSSGRYSKFKEIAFDYAFILKTLGISE
jgi:oligopeptidase B